MKTCPNCGFDCRESDTECIKCGIIFEKWQKAQKEKEKPQENTQTKSLAGENEYYVEKHGILSFQGLKDLAAKKEIDKATRIYVGNLGDWVKAETIPWVFEIPFPLQKIIGILAILGGAIGLIYALKMQTTVGDIHNIGLLSKQNNYIIVSGVIMLIGVIMTVFSPKKNLLDAEMKECPECAEFVKKKAKNCRFCGHIFDE